MKYFIDGDWVIVTLDDFVDLQQSPAQLVPVNSEAGQSVIAGGVRQLPFGLFREIFGRLKRERGQRVQAAIISMITESPEHKTQATVPDLLELIGKLASALQLHHSGLDTTLNFRKTYKANAAILQEAQDLLVGSKNND